jgi:hypothetical protein
MAVDSQVDAPKLLEALERQDPPPAIFGDRAGMWETESGGVACPSMGSLLDKREGHDLLYVLTFHPARDHA